MNQQDLDHITAPARSSDMSVMETWMSSLRRRFYARRTASIKTGMKRFKKVFNELPQNKINQNVVSYRARLHELQRMSGNMTKY